MNDNVNELTAEETGQYEIYYVKKIQCMYNCC